MYKMERLSLLFFCVFIMNLFFSANSIAQTTDDDFHEMVEKGTAQIIQARKSMAEIIAYMSSQAYISATPKDEHQNSINREQRLSVWNTYQAFLGYIRQLDSLGQEYSEYYKNSEGEREKTAFRVSFAAFLAQYRYAMDFITVMEKNPDFHVVLNELVPEIGLPQGTYSDLKYRFLNVILGAEFARLNVVYGFYGKDTKLRLTKGMEEDNTVIWQAGTYKGPTQTMQNGIKILKDAAFKVWFPVQKEVSQFLGEHRVRRGDEFLISSKQIKAMIAKLQPGDILLQRREWCMTNIGLPGFWTHAALYIGTPEEQREFFNDPDVAKWVKTQDGDAKTFEDLLTKKYSRTYSEYVKPVEDNHRVRVIEAIAEGVVFTSLEHSADADSIVVLRPKLPKRAKAKAVLQAFHFYGRPYDYNFDFLTDASLVCSEVVYKAYLPTESVKGLCFPLSEMLGRNILAPNNIARMYDEEHKRSSQLELVLFLDGDERKNKALESSEEVFLKSWKRPKWHIITKGTLLDTSK